MQIKYKATRGDGLVGDIGLDELRLSKGECNITSGKRL